MTQTITKRITVALTKQEVKMLDRLKELFGQNQSKLMGSALTALYYTNFPIERNEKISALKPKRN